MSFVVNYLVHAHHDVREASVKIVVKVVLLSDEAHVSPYLKKIMSKSEENKSGGILTPQLLKTIRGKIKEARGLNKGKGKHTEFIYSRRIIFG